MNEYVRERERELNERESDGRRNSSWWRLNNFIKLQNAITINNVVWYLSTRSLESDCLGMKYETGHPYE